MCVRSFCVIYLICFYGSKALSIEERLVKVEQTLEHQEVTLKHQEKTMQDQETTIKNHEKENQDLKLRLKMLENERDKVKECYTTGDLDQKGMKTADDNQSTLSHLNGVIKQQSGGIAFHAYMTGSKCVQDKELVVFDTVAIDDGDGYYPEDGIYVVPENGTYMFIWTLFSTKGEWSVSDIIVDGKTKGWIATDDENDQATGVIIVQVSVGIHVFIEKRTGDGCIVQDEFSRSTFTGWKLY